MDWGGQGNGDRGQTSRQDQFGGQSGWGDEGYDQVGGQRSRGQGRFGEQYGQGGYGQDYGRQATDWQGGRYGDNQSFGQGGG